MLTPEAQTRAKKNGRLIAGGWVIIVA